ncbi:bifunctional alpha,alpha-trehalose-phosphate synthase (UDP-forming)/trehalose-phosphatase [Rubritalea marina]|uniref:bifunctional alpha,alpha-trehalose-phosphate synthase (UDP-forming)/trehalose-phosphatase n=1 Tax=Rubritalea marina TaxID=361055 RepID=UPI00037987A0|nr:bifunctional alpha,alpha-trehalose-phosphate synthase (UDP-forming)/trehalose-phosphatase [Rubritalea marina]
MTSFIIASNRLPFKLDASGEFQPCAGGLVSALNGVIDNDTTTWVGTAQAPQSRQLREKQHAYFQSQRIEAIYLSKLEFDGYYNGFSNSCLWPLLHYMCEICEHDPEWDVHYKSVNQQFANRIAEIADEGACVWIHDYHLMLVPSMLRALRPDLQIGFFLHTPFPSSEVFRALPERESILKGLLGCDLIGFHTFGYLRHFQSAVLRLTGHHADHGEVRFRNRTVKLGVFPIGHDHVNFEKSCDEPKYLEMRQHIQHEYADKKIILSVERLDYTKGFPEKLKAIRHFLTHHPEHTEQVSFVLIAVPSRLGLKHYDLLTKQVKNEIGDINQEFGRSGYQPIQMIHGSFEVEELAAYYAEAAVCLVTPIIDGMNLVAKEFIACKSPCHLARPGVLVLSEFAGAAEEMPNALLVNPFDTTAVADAMVEALTMPRAEIEVRNDELLARLEYNDARNWANRYIKELKATTGKPQNDKINELKRLLKACKDTLSEKQHLNLFLDYDGTLRAFTNRPEDATPSLQLLADLQAITANPQIDVTIVSGRAQSFLNQHFAHLPVNLVAEHGAASKHANSPHWLNHSATSETDDWKTPVIECLNDTCLGTPGSEVEEKKYSVVWHYRQVDPEFGEWQAKVLKSHLEKLAESLPIKVQHGQKIVEVSHQNINKGYAVLKHLEQQRPQLAICFGDDVTDEAMFEIQAPRGTSLQSVKIGSGDTAAEFRSTIPLLAQFLHKLADEHQHLNREPINTRSTRI